MNLESFKEGVIAAVDAIFCRNLRRDSDNYSFSNS
jgi:hypothetical protein